MRFGREKNEGKGEERRLWRGEWGEEMGDRRWGRGEGGEKSIGFEIIFLSYKYIQERSCICI